MAISFVNLSKELNTHKQMEIQVLDEVGKERFSLWDNQVKKFIKEGEQLMTENGLQEVNKFIKLTPEEKKRYTRKLVLNRKVVYNGNESIIGFPVTVDKKISDIFQDMKVLSKNPFHFSLVVEKEGTGIGTRYNVKIGKEVGQYNKQENALMLSDKEKALIEAIKNNTEAMKYDTPKKVMLFKTNLGIDEARAMNIVTSFL